MRYFDDDIKATLEKFDKIFNERLPISEYFINHLIEYLIGIYSINQHVVVIYIDSHDRTSEEFKYMTNIHKEMMKSEDYREFFYNKLVYKSLSDSEHELIEYLFVNKLDDKYSIIINKLEVVVYEYKRKNNLLNKNDEDDEDDDIEIRIIPPSIDINKLDVGIYKIIWKSMEMSAIKIGVSDWDGKKWMIYLDHFKIPFETIKEDLILSDIESIEMIYPTNICYDNEMNNIIKNRSRIRESPC